MFKTVGNCVLFQLPKYLDEAALLNRTDFVKNSLAQELTFMTFDPDFSCKFKQHQNAIIAS